MCNCIKQTEKKLQELFEKEVDSPDYESVQLEGKALLLNGNDMQLATFTEVKYKIGNKSKKWKKNVLFAYCPFCGKKYSK
jgi:hypothetical protein